MPHELDVLGNVGLAEIHHRMPMRLHYDDYRREPKLLRKFGIFGLSLISLNHSRQSILKLRTKRHVDTA
eukprot:COSAG02_NODE_40886_length_400_cov_1.000000_1_plen_69_part_00